MSSFTKVGIPWMEIALASASFAAASVGVTICALGPAIGFGSLGLRFLFGVSALAISGGALFCLVSRQMRETHLAQVFLDRLTSGSADNLPTISPRSTWCPLLNQVRETQESVHSRVAEAEHARAVLEVRHKRCQADNERMSRILAVVSDPLIAVDAYDEILMTNRAAEKLLGLEGQSPEKRVLGHINRCERLLGLIKDTQRRKSPATRNEEMELEEADGTRRWYNASVITLADSGEKPAGDGGVVTVLRDITPLKHIQKHNAEFVSNASHEMKAPLAGIRAYVELLADGDAEDEDMREEFLKVINSQTDRLQRLVENLLNLARIEAGVVKVQKQNQALNEILIEAFNVIQPSAQGKAIEMTHHLSEMYLGVHVDRDLMLQCVINLLSNAVKYTSTGGRVTLRSRLLGDEVQFEVEDSGVGLSPEDCDKVFERFYRVEKDKNMAAGTGLGLPLAKYIVEGVHGGRLTVKSQLGVGSTFLVTVPAAAH